MYKYLLEQEKILMDALKHENELEKVYEYAKTQIAWISHERLVHLMVTLFFGLLLLISLFSAMIFNHVLTDILSVILAIYVVLYIVHYYRLERGIQRLYKISNQIYNKMKMQHIVVSDR